MFFVVETYFEVYGEKMNKIYLIVILSSLFLSSCSSQQTSSICSTCKCDNQTIRFQTMRVSVIHDQAHLGNHPFDLFVFIYKNDLAYLP